ncbi:MAG: hypothetical protein IPK66_13735 [Rhodospirillales bacterium]|nr:hypothetical protein [Rhodospirillales bacterium]
MNIMTWKRNLIEEIEAAAERRTQEIFADAGEERRAIQSQETLLGLAAALRAMPDDEAHLAALFTEEAEMAAVDGGAPGEAEHRFHEAKEDLLRLIGFEQEPFATADAFLDAVRGRADEIIAEYRLVAAVPA